MERQRGEDSACDGFDYSTPESLQALANVTELVREIRDERSGPVSRRLRLYERTLGLAVIPVLIRRGLIVLGRRLRAGRAGR